MYKRKPHILFHAEQPGWSLLAYGQALRLGGNWFEARACYNERQLQNWWEKSLGFLDLPNQVEPINEALLAWADLLITLDTNAQQKLTPLPRTTRHKHWPLEQAPTVARQQIGKRIEGMLGGIRLLNRPPTAVTIL